MTHRSGSVSVIIPAFNAERFIGRTLANVSLQSRRPQEVLVVDDGSTDRTSAIAEAYGARVILGNHRGPAAARNLGLEKASSEWIAFLDADDVWHPEKIERQLQASSLIPDADIIASDYDVIDDSGTLLRERCVLSLRQFAAYSVQIREGVSRLDNDSLAGSLAEWCIFLPGVVMLRKRAIEEIGYFDEALSFGVEDVEFFLRCIKKCRVAFVESSLLGYVQHDRQIAKTLLELRSSQEIGRQVIRNSRRYHPSTVSVTRARQPLLEIRAMLTSGKSRQDRQSFSVVVHILRGVTSSAFWGRNGLRVLARIAATRRLMRTNHRLRHHLDLIPGRRHDSDASFKNHTEWKKIIASADIICDDKHHLSVYPFDS